jgi:hypothetical protein
MTPHRSVDEQAGLPPARRRTTSPAATTCWPPPRTGWPSCTWPAWPQVPGPVSRDRLAELIGANLLDSATRYRTRYLAVFELTLAASRQPALAETLAQLGIATLQSTVAEHRALDLPTTAGQVQALMTLFGGTLLTLVTGPPEAITPQATLALARAIVRGVLGTGP